MTPSKAKRAAMLCAALDDLDSWETEVDGAQPKECYSQCVLSLGIWSTGADPSAGGAGHGEIHLDMVTAQRLAPAVRRVIEGELGLLGVHLEPSPPQTEAGEK